MESCSENLSDTDSKMHALLNNVISRQNHTSDDLARTFHVRRAYPETPPVYNDMDSNNMNNFGIRVENVHQQVSFFSRQLGDLRRSLISLNEKALDELDLGGTIVSKQPCKDREYIRKRGHPDIDEYSDARDESSSFQQFPPERHAKATPNKKQRRRNPRIIHSDSESDAHHEIDLSHKTPAPGSSRTSPKAIAENQ